MFIGLVWLALVEYLCEKGHSTSGRNTYRVEQRSGNPRFLLGCYVEGVIIAVHENCQVGD
jgi:hypothetical protein